MIRGVTRRLLLFQNKNKRMQEVNIASINRVKFTFKCIFCSEKLVFENDVIVRPEENSNRLIMKMQCPKCKKEYYRKYNFGTSITEEVYETMSEAESQQEAGSTTQEEVLEQPAPTTAEQLLGINSTMTINQQPNGLYTYTTEAATVTGAGQF